MNRKQYIDELRVRLQGLDAQEIEDAIAYCNEYFDDAGIENEASVIQELGSPFKFAAQMKADSAIQRQEKNEDVNHHPWKSFLAIIMGILALPLAFPMLIILIVGLFVLVVVVGSILFGIVTVMVSLLFSAIPLFLYGITSFTTPAIAFIAIGGALIAFGIGILFVLLIMFMVEKLLPALTRWLTKVYNKAKKEKTYEKA